ncbi:MAG: M48 family metallopeptidase [Myxococcaceae bacterium]
MDFFEHQREARRRTWQLLGLMLAAVGVIATAVYVAFRVFVVDIVEGVPLFDPWLFTQVVGVTLAVVAAGTIYKWLRLSRGGEALARDLGGQRVDVQTVDLHERRLLNVVEEMAIAAGMPVPAVYVLPDEPGINAFAAGLGRDDATIAVTDGCLRLLSRSELQGVIGHEVSHLLNGDAKVNLRIIGLVHGILVISLIGQSLLRGMGRTRVGFASRKRVQAGGGTAGLAMLGLALWGIGYIGVVFARLIKSAVSRQREFLADASSVQFTRDSSALASALKKIGGLTTGSRLQLEAAEEASHLFFADGLRRTLTGLWATHPPLEERVRRLEPGFKGDFPTTSEVPVDVAAELPVSAAVPSGVPRHSNFADDLVASIGTLDADHLAYARSLLAEVPMVLRAACRTPEGAQAATMALLLDADAAARRPQLVLLERALGPSVTGQADQLAGAVRAMRVECRLPVLDLALPVLRELPHAKRHTFAQVAEAVVRTDGRLSLFEWVLETALVRHLAGERAGENGDTRRPLGEACHTLLQAVAASGVGDPARVAKAVEAGQKILLEARIASFGPSGGSSGKPQTLQDVREALKRVASTSPRLKRTILHAAATACAAQGSVSRVQGELLRAIADTLGCPTPPLLPGQRVGL